MSPVHPAMFSTGKSERLEARISKEQKEIVQRAAELSGRSLTDFIIDSAMEAAERAIRTHQVLELTARSTAAFTASLANPPAPNDNLRRAAQRYRDFVAE